MSIIAFVPARGGSKSIPLKNIKNFCEKPLLYWSLNSLENTVEVDKVIVATDCDEIEKTVKEFEFSKIHIYRRKPENATDISSTESVMLEYLEDSGLKAEDIFMLVQATSPFTQSQDFTKAIAQYLERGCDSLLSGTRIKRFFWNKDGTPLNYNYESRPRRQDFDGLFMENGAFYINKVENILKNKNRLYGKIGLYEMPEFTSLELDEPDDWIIGEQLMKKCLLTRPTDKKQIKIFLTDVDGVLTDAGMYYSETGDELKKFNTRDGMGFQLLRNKGIKTGFITSEITQLVIKRAEKLQIDFLHQGKKNKGKLDAALEICSKENISLKEVAYIGDDINCIELLSKVGLAACPADAVNEVKEIPDILILNKRGGEGCVREFIDKHILIE